MRLRPLAIAFAVFTGLLSGCGDSADSSAPRDASAQLEGLITRQLPRKIRSLAGPDTFVSDVRCVHQGGNSYQCIASVSGSNAYSGRYERTQLPIEATCDERSCIWKVAP